MLTLEQAQANRIPIDWSSYEPPVPEFLGLRVAASTPGSALVPSAGDGVPPSRTSPEPESSRASAVLESSSRRDAETSTRDECATRRHATRWMARLSIPLEKLVEYIDWSPFFHTWELRGRYPAIFDDEVVGEQARELFADAQQLLQRIVSEKLLTARGVFGFWPANSLGDDRGDLSRRKARGSRGEVSFSPSADAEAGRASRIIAWPIWSRRKVPGNAIISAGSRSRPESARTSWRKNSRPTTTTTTRS